MNRWLELLLVCALFMGIAVSHGVDSAKAAASTEKPSALKGMVSDVDGRAVQGAKVFVYDSTDVRRSANFISAGSDKEGFFRMVLPPGKYWVVARLKKTDDYGPLMPGDKHSGESAEIEVASGGEVALDFIVADLKETIKAKAKTRERPVKIGGRIVDRDGTPVTGAYAIAQSNEKITGIPDYLSAWVDDEGRYTLYLPKGTYYFGAAYTFPLNDNFFMQGKISVDNDRTDVVITRKLPDTK
jgi:hypothetical protein